MHSVTFTSKKQTNKTELLLFILELKYVATIPLSLDVVCTSCY